MKRAVVLFNLGGPDSLKAVRPFLFNLFRDGAIIQLPALARYPLAALIATTRNRTAQANYAIMGGRSPLLPETEKQARALEAELGRRTPGVETRVFISMRYWKPRADETARAVAAFAPDEIVLLPLYPQFSTTTSASSIRDWIRAYKGPGRTRTVCCYPTAPGFVAAYAQAIRQTWEAAGRPANVRLLFSAHGLPKRIVEAGDPYQAQVEASAAAIAALLPEFADWKVCYQSRVGRLEWLGPATDDEVRRAAADGKGLLICPVAFVSEHVETLVELDHEYADLAREQGIATYLRAPTPTVAESFIGTLADAVQSEAAADPAPFGPWLCPADYGKCACRQGQGRA
ncbi:ferrochelatase [Phenylobacterium sp.]|uniref:ferrochelatase n=1 Tax=Phenylobacterium sp. TaxID=1871053 RepID=UPI002811C661|nr:ferrochelatase [Phenylobacterium sp.]